VLCAFDLLELDGEDLRRTPIEERKGVLAKAAEPVP
jgi:ATP-dependent DNA ligase